MNKALRVIQEVEKAVIGKRDCIIKAMSAILAGGHILIEDIPGVGKTTLAVAFSKAMNLENRRIQFTPDVLPADVTGFSMYQKETNSFVYQPGAVMCNLFLADEINRTSPKTQSALLEVMEEKKVTVDGVTRQLPDPFIVIATQNPIGSAGTQLLPESQLDRFMICMSMGYPDMEQELAIVKGKSNPWMYGQVEPVIYDEELRDLRKEVEQIYIHDDIYHYMGNIVQATRNHPMIELGVSPRGLIALAKIVKAYAFLMERQYVLPEDVLAMLEAVVAHRIRLNGKARAGRVTVANVLEDIVNSLQKPSIRTR